MFFVLSNAQSPRCHTLDFVLQATSIPCALFPSTVGAGSGSIRQQTRLRFLCVLQLDVLVVVDARVLLPSLQEQALQATRTKLQSELGDRAIKRAIFKRGNFRDLPEGVAPMSVQLIV